MTFEREQLIRFSHCDPAGIVFFPQYFVLFNGHVEDWFDDGLALGYAKRRDRPAHRAADGRAATASSCGRAGWASA